MAKIKDVIERVDGIKPSAFSMEQKMTWLTQLDGKIAADIMLISIMELRQMQYKYPEDMETELLVSFPHEDLYDYWLAAQIDYANGEYDKYQNSMAMFNECYDNFAVWFLSTYDPAQGYVRSDNYDV